MPELPEVETVARSLRPHLLGRSVTGLWHSGLSLRAPLDDRALRGLRGLTFQAVDRVGKYLLFRFAQTPAPLLLGHLGMTGRLLVCPEGAPLAPHTHLRAALGQDRELRYVDPRRFGVLRVVPPGETPEEIADLGPDPLGADFTVAYLREALRATRRPLKVALLDQRLVAGLGNIYVAEALFRAGLSPLRPAPPRGLSSAAAARLHGAIQEVLRQGIERRGTTLSDGGYVDAEGMEGDNLAALFVYGREGQGCRRCEGIIVRHVQAQRSSFYCPKCQR